MPPTKSGVPATIIPNARARERLVELRRVLKDTGSIYLHCDPTAGHAA